MRDRFRREREVQNQGGLESPIIPKLTSGWLSAGSFGFQQKCPRLRVRGEFVAQLTMNRV